MLDLILKTEAVLLHAVTLMRDDSRRITQLTLNPLPQRPVQFPRDPVIVDSASFLAEISDSSPRGLFILINYKNIFIFRIKVSKKYFI